MPGVSVALHCSCPIEIKAQDVKVHDVWKQFETKEFKLHLVYEGEIDQECLISLRLDSPFGC